jgi:hypothetical protein
MIHLLAFWSIWIHPLGQCSAASTDHMIAAHEIARCKSYNWVSGAGADLSELGIFGVVLAAYKQHTCRAHWWCPCVAKHKVDGTTASVCHFHHTDALHRKLQARHKHKYSRRLAHGESPKASGINLREEP